jgi:hypothetical protein
MAIKVGININSANPNKLILVIAKEVNNTMNPTINDSVRDVFISKF